jgi:hypothetical protein
VQKVTATSEVIPLAATHTIPIYGRRLTYHTNAQPIRQGADLWELADAYELWRHATKSAKWSTLYNRTTLAHVRWVLEFFTLRTVADLATSFDLARLEGREVRNMAVRTLENHRRSFMWFLKWLVHTEQIGGAAFECLRRIEGHRYTVVALVE